MLTFFRKIRKGLLGTGATRKYMLYAVGEVLLVMIGILLALQVNNWNSERQATRIEGKLLTELLNPIQTDFGFLRFSMESNKEIQNSCEIILLHLDNDLPYHDSLDYHFMNSNNWMSLHFTKHAYENAKSYGLGFLSDSLRLQLSRFYELAITFGDEMMERQNLYYYNTAVPILTDLFRESITPLLGQDGVVPNNYGDLKNEMRYKNILRTSIRNRANENTWRSGLLRKMKRLEQYLTKEIESR